MKIVIAGATGLIGKALTKKLISYDRYYLTNRRDDGFAFGTVGDKSGFKSCKVQVYFSNDGVKRLRMGLKSIFNPFHSYKDCNFKSDTL